ncbi:MAG: hypothetical protein ACJA2M_001419 [Polaribacter sp.]|jgi:hypothetical protein
MPGVIEPELWSKSKVDIKVLEKIKPKFFFYNVNHIIEGDT